MVEHTMEEIWKAIPDYDGLYEASSRGRIRSAPNKVTSSARFERRVWKTRIMKTKHPYGKKRQDERVSLWKDGVVRTWLVARLVASAWHGKPSTDDMTVNHIDGDWSNNRPDNLEWVTRKENISLANENGQYDSIMKRVTLCGERKTLAFRSMADASLYLGRNRGYVSGMCRKGMNIVRAKNGDKYRVIVQEKFT